MSKTEKSSSLDSYYRNCPFPKPAKKKKKLLCNGYKNKAERRCYYTGQPGADRQELSVMIQPEVCERRNT